MYLYKDLNTKQCQGGLFGKTNFQYECSLSLMCIINIKFLCITFLILLLLVNSLSNCCFDLKYCVKTT